MACPAHGAASRQGHQATAALAYLQSLPSEATTQLGPDPARVTHHPAGAPYLHPAMSDGVLWAHLRSSLAGPAAQRALVCAHSHRPMDRQIQGRRYVCVPPVGQPRDGDPRAGYAVESDGRFEFRRVSYDVERTVTGLGQIGLAGAFVERWERFVRTGWDAEWSRDYRPPVADEARRP